MFVTAYPFAVAGAVLVLVRSRLLLLGHHVCNGVPVCCCRGRVCIGAFPLSLPGHLVCNDVRVCCCRVTCLPVVLVTNCRAVRVMRR